MKKTIATALFAALFALTTRDCQAQDFSGRFRDQEGALITISGTGPKYQVRRELRSSTGNSIMTGTGRRDPQGRLIAKLSPKSPRLNKSLRARVINIFNDSAADISLGYTLVTSLERLQRLPQESPDSITEDAAGHQPTARSSQPHRSERLLTTAERLSDKQEQPRRLPPVEPIAALVFLFAMLAAKKRGRKNSGSKSAGNKARAIALGGLREVIRLRLSDLSSEITLLQRASKLSELEQQLKDQSADTHGNSAPLFSKLRRLSTSLGALQRILDSTLDFPILARKINALDPSQDSSISARALQDAAREAQRLSQTTHALQARLRTVATKLENPHRSKDLDLVFADIDRLFEDATNGLRGDASPSHPFLAKLSSLAEALRYEGGHGPAELTEIVTELSQSPSGRAALEPVIKAAEHKPELRKALLGAFLREAPTGPQKAAALAKYFNERLRDQLDLAPKGSNLASLRGLLKAKLYARDTTALGQLDSSTVGRIDEAKVDRLLADISTRKDVRETLNAIARASRIKVLGTSSLSQAQTQFRSTYAHNQVRRLLAASVTDRPSKAQALKLRAEILRFGQTRFADLPKDKQQEALRSATSVLNKSAKTGLSVTRLTGLARAGGGATVAVAGLFGLIDDLNNPNFSSEERIERSGLGALKLGAGTDDLRTLASFLRNEVSIEQAVASASRLARLTRLAKGLGPAADAISSGFAFYEAGLDYSRGDTLGALNKTGAALGLGTISAAGVLFLLELSPIALPLLLLGITAQLGFNAADEAYGESDIESFIRRGVKVDGSPIDLWKDP